MRTTREEGAAVEAGLLTREGTENFPVALRVLPRRHRADLHAVYAFARTVDELGDSAPDDRTAQLLAFDEDLRRVWRDGVPEHPVLRRLRDTVAAHDLPAEPFHDLVRANLQDQQVTRYRTFEELTGYCRLSADPVGRIVLGVFEATDPDLVPLSDKVCTALQLLEHCQDLAEDRRNGRVYLPAQDLAAYGVPETDLDRDHATPELASVVGLQVDRAAELLAEGRVIVSGLHGWARMCVAGFVAGGDATTAALRGAGCEVLARSVRPSRAGTAARLLALLLRPPRPGHALDE